MSKPRPPIVRSADDPRTPEHERPCMGCAEGILVALSGRHPQAVGNTLLIALDMWINTFPAEAQPGMFRAIGASFEHGARTCEAEQASGIAMGPAQGSA